MKRDFNIDQLTNNDYKTIEINQNIDSITETYIKTISENNKKIQDALELGEDLVKKLE